MKLDIDNNSVQLTNINKLLWPELGISKITYIKTLIQLAPYIIKYSTDRLLTTIRYPDGYEGKSFYQKNCPSYAPDWIDTIQYKKTKFINLNKMSTLIWLANKAAIELHGSFNSTRHSNHPEYLVFDLDPSYGQVFDDVIEAALKIHQTLNELGIKSYIKTSGATGLQIYIPIGLKYDYDDARLINKFFGQYFAQKYPNLFTIERTVSRRESKLYFDYLQMWHGKSIILPYSPRATENATISMPLTWDEVQQGINPKDFTILNAVERIEKMGDIFEDINQVNNHNNLDFIYNNIVKKPLE